MKAAVATGKNREAIVKEVPTPQVQPGTLLLKTKYASICGGDLEWLDRQSGDLEFLKLYEGARFGHEYCAEVAAVGEGVTGWSVGDRAVPGYPSMCCGQCYFCRNGLGHLCVGGSPRDIFPTPDQLPGGYGAFIGALAEYFVMLPYMVQKVPDSVSDEEATLIDPLAPCVAIVTQAGVRLGSSVVIVGAGRLGLISVMLAKASGATTVIAIDLIKSRLDKALEVGADVALNANEVDVVSEVVKLTEAGPDAVLICTRGGQVLEQAVDMVRRGGIVVIGGGMPPMEVDPLLWLLKRVRVEGSQGGSVIDPIGATTISMQLLANKRVNVRPIISEIMPLGDIQRALDSMYSGKNLAVLLKP